MISPIQFTPGMDMNALTSALNINMNQIESENRTKIVRDETGVDRVLIGRYPDGTYGVKVSKPGKDVKDAQDGDLYFNSNQNTLKIVKTGTITTNTYPINGVAGQWKNSNSSSPQFVAHNLGYVPIVLGFYDVSGLGQYSLMPDTQITAGSTSSVLFQTVSLMANDTNLYVRDLTRTFGAETGTGGGHVIKYYLLQETAA